MEEIYEVMYYCNDEFVDNDETNYQGTYQDCVEWIEDFQEDYPELEFVIVRITDVTQPNYDK